MKQSPSDTYGLYDKDDAFHPPSGTPSSVLPGLPSSWQLLGWRIGGIMFAALWMFQSRSVTSSSLSKEDIGRWVESCWSLLLALAVCYGIFKFCKPQYERLGSALCIISAIVLLLQRMS